MISLDNIKVIKSILRGESVLDWNRLYFKKESDVIEFLKLNCFDLNKDLDKRRLDFIFNDAIDYLSNIHKLDIPNSFRKEKITDLFLYASKREDEKKARLSCALLKLMNIINHIDSQDLVSKIQIERQWFLNKLRKKINLVMLKMKKSLDFDFKFELSIKKRESIISKFVSKKEGIVARIFDRIRFRIITEKKEDIIPVLEYLINNLFPYNYVIPSETVNNLIGLSGGVDNLQIKESNIKMMNNKFSGPSYKVLNFIVDIPMRIDDVLVLPQDISFANYAYIIYVLTEIQIVDKNTHINNELGENSHVLYKARQKDIIYKRLFDK